MKVTDYDTIVRLMGSDVFAWDSKYEEFYVRECGGTYGMDSVKEGCSKETRTMINEEIGAEENMDVHFCCTTDECCTVEQVENEVCGAMITNPLSLSFVTLVW
eukprot:CAMPEP_0117754698 /NCGR_PEP_ID=MMETSP0947-20121206/12977_1 /TAXON_ID=44440 /ORGANISM="Chattonella subsalsa, Strain CCMP2191" /LENGTH=102 /DNA_ID=CAMNT_0005573823 /DNA_START=345 /DNA_END=650 /DNA_ORIENTATION=+